MLGQVNPLDPIGGSKVCRTVRVEDDGVLMVRQPLDQTGQDRRQLRLLGLGDNRGEVHVQISVRELRD